jgi:hypothetical protein
MSDYRNIGGILKNKVQASMRIVVMILSVLAIPSNLVR